MFGRLTDRVRSFSRTDGVHDLTVATRYDRGPKVFFSAIARAAPPGGTGIARQDCQMTTPESRTRNRVSLAVGGPEPPVPRHDRAGLPADNFDGDHSSIHRHRTPTGPENCQLTTIPAEASRRGRST